jgi:Eco57I restriction-modification methylase/MmeI, target recognition domain
MSKDRDTRFHEEWLGLAQPIEGLVFSVPVLADAQIAPEIRSELSALFDSHLTDGENGSPRLRSTPQFFREFLGFDQPGMLVPRGELPKELSFYAQEGGQEIRPTFALGRGPFDAEDPFAVFGDSSTSTKPSTSTDSLIEKYFALAWNLEEHGVGIDLDHPESTTGPWRYPPTAKFERLLRHVGIPIGILSNGESIRLIYAPSGETTGHLTFRLKDLREPAGRPVLAALDLLLHARRAYQAAPQFTLEGLLAESRRRQADVTLELAKQVFEAVEMLVGGFEAAAARDCTGNRLDWLRPALEAEADHFYQGVLSVVLRLVFLLYAEDQGLLPVEHPMYAQHLSLFGLYERLSHDAGAHPESMHHRFGAYGQLLSLFRAVFFGVKHGSLVLPPRRGKLFDPNAFPFLEGGQPDWTAAVVSPEARAQALPPSIDDGSIYRILHKLVVFEGQRLSYRALDVEQIGSVYESLMGYHVLRLTSPAVRIGKHGMWIEAEAVRALTTTDRVKLFKESCGLNPGPIKALEKAIKDAKNDEAELVEALSAQAMGKKADILRHKAAAGRLVVQPGEERRRTGSHYTPRSLTEKVVKRTLEPLLACIGEDRNEEQILELKICDPAMGSGAFLVAACRELAGELVQAWTRSGELSAIIEQHGDAHLHARRLVAQRCLYGVDKNPAAVELAKLSLWLITLSKTLPFTFVDHALRHGDSLVGFDFDQIRAFHWKPQKQLELCEVTLREALEQAVELRQRILALADKEDPASQEEKRRLLDFSQQAIGRVRLVADVCVGAFFAESKDAARERERVRRLGLVEAWLAGDESKRAELEDWAREIRKAVSPFHWWIEFPEVFFEERPDPLEGGKVNRAALMEAVVGNPPFGGKNNIIDGNPDGYLDWLKIASPGAHGNSDLSAHFFRRAAGLLGEHGTFGLIATNTIAQGDTRTTGLKPLVEIGWSIYDATDSMLWPGAAAVTVSLVHAAHGRAREGASARLGDREVQNVNSRLRPKPERPDPTVLHANAGSAFVGSYLLGMGFTMTPEECDALRSNDPKNGERLFPYLGGEEVNTSPTQSPHRCVISFGQMSLEEAERWPYLIRIVREKVKPQRDQDNREVRRKYWWRFGEVAPALYASIAPLKRCLVTSRVTKHLSFSYQPTDRIFAETLYAFSLERFTAFATLQSRVHRPWAWLLSSSMKTDLRYSASDCFETFPFPRPDPRTVIPELEAIGEKLYEARAKYMADTDQGLTKTYNAIKDPSCTDARILELRELHEEMDRAVLDAYGWTDVAVPPFCPLSDADTAAVQAFEDEVIDRLYVLNAERAREEKLLGRSAKGRGKAAKKGGKRGKKTPEGQGGLF